MDKKDIRKTGFTQRQRKLKGRFKENKLSEDSSNKESICRNRKADHYSGKRHQINYRYITKFITKYIGKSFDLAYSKFCEITKDHLVREAFKRQFMEKHERWGSFYIDDNNIICENPKNPFGLKRQSLNFKKVDHRWFFKFDDVWYEIKYRSTISVFEHDVFVSKYKLSSTGIEEQVRRIRKELYGRLDINVYWKQQCTSKMAKILRKQYG